MAAEAVCVQGNAYGIGMQVQLSRNGADLPMLGMKEMADVGDLFIGNHASPRGKDSPSARGVHRSDTRPSRKRIRAPWRGSRPTPEWSQRAQEPGRREVHTGRSPE